MRLASSAIHKLCSSIYPVLNETFNHLMNAFNKDGGYEKKKSQKGGTQVQKFHADYNIQSHPNQGVSQEILEDELTVKSFGGNILHQVRIQKPVHSQLQPVKIQSGEYGAKDKTDCQLRCPPEQQSR